MIIEKAYSTHARRGRARAWVPLGWCLAVWIGAAPAEARRPATPRERPDSQERSGHLAIGQQFQFEPDGGQSEWSVPALVRLGLTDDLQCVIEVGFLSIRSDKGRTLRGWGDLETSLTWELADEGRWRPALALQGVVKWPTASRLELGSGARDYALGAIVSRTFARMDVEMSVLYTFIGQASGDGMPGMGHAFEASLGVGWALGRVVDLEAEVSVGGELRGRTGAFGGVILPGAGAGESTPETAWTSGVVERLGPRLTLEEAVVYRSDGSSQLVAGWEWSLSRGAKSAGPRGPADEDPDD